MAGLAFRPIGRQRREKALMIGDKGVPQFATRLRNAIFNFSEK